MRYKFPETGNKPTDDLGRQLEKIVHTWNRASIKTRYRYADACARFVKWAQPNFKIQKLANLANKHIIAYGRHLKDQGRSEKYIKNEISALQYLHFSMPNPRHVISESKKINREIGLGSTPNNKAANLDQTWTHAELARFCAYARENGRPELAKMAEMTYITGCRLEEISTLRRYQIENALKTGVLHLTNTKGGRKRDIPLTGDSRPLLGDILEKVQRGSYIFIPAETPVQFQSLIGRINTPFKAHSIASYFCYWQYVF